MRNKALGYYRSELEKIKEGDLWKEERVISSPQNARITMEGRSLLNMCSNNYLGLANNDEVIRAAHESLEKWGYGMASVRFICGTLEIHKQLERELSRFLGTEDTILYSSCFDANGGIFEVLLNQEDAVISDELNHASIIDGVRLCKAARYRYRNNDMEDLEKKLIEAKNKRIRLIVTDGVFSMDGIIADLRNICDLADKYGALVMVDDSHATGFMGERGRGSHEYCNVMDRVDVLTGTLGKALGGASGGYVSGRKEIINLLRQRSRPYLFSNTLAPSIAAVSLKVLEMLTNSTELKDKLFENTRFYRSKLIEAGFDINDSMHPIVPIMLGDAVLSQKMSSILSDKGVYVVGFFYPVVPRGKARIRTQVTAAHTLDDLEYAVKMISETWNSLGVQT